MLKGKRVSQSYWQRNAKNEVVSMRHDCFSSYDIDSTRHETPNPADGVFTLEPTPEPVGADRPCNKTASDLQLRRAQRHIITKNQLYRLLMVHNRATKSPLANFMSDSMTILYILYMTPPPWGMRIRPGEGEEGGRKVVVFIFSNASPPPPETHTPDNIWGILHHIGDYITLQSWWPCLPPHHNSAHTAE